MRAYIAADSHLQEAVKHLRNELVARDIEVTSRWIDAKLEAHHPATDDVMVRAAHDNFSDIDRAVFLIAYNPLIRQRTGTGGRHVEMGYALAKNKYVLYVGEKFENVFHYHAGVIYVSDLSGITTAHGLATMLATTIRRIWNETTQMPSER